MLKGLWSKIFGSSLDDSLADINLEKELKNIISTLNWKTDHETSILISHYIIKTLREAQTCHRCILRFLDCRNNSLFTYTEKELDYAFDHLLGRSAPSKVEVCTACLGALQYADDYDIIIKPILNRLEKEQYETTTFNMTATLPISMSHREKLLKFHLSNQLKNTVYIKKLILKNNKNNNKKDDEMINDVVKAWKYFGMRDAKEPFRLIVTNQLVKASSSSSSSITTTNVFDNDNTEPIIPITNLKYHPQAQLHINLIMHHSLTSTEHLFLTQVNDPILRIRKIKKRGVEKTIGDSRQNINEALKALDEDEARRITTVPPSPQSEISNIDEINITHDSSYTGGRYLKYSRECSQTPWAIQGKKLAEISVSECIVDVFKKYHKCDDIKFVTAGREDANVRMLGTGRPFYCELTNPRRPVLKKEEYHQMEMEINSSPISKDIVQVRQIQQILPNETKIIKEGEEKKRKTYRALVWFSEPLTQDMIDKCNKAGENEFITYQKTPIRVFQRRGAAVREKTIHTLKMEKAEDKPNSHFAIVYMNTQAGTYIKEFVHGDLGRTKPNLATITNVKYADLIELDVMEVDLEWPPLPL